MYVKPVPPYLNIFLSTYSSVSAKTLRTIFFFRGTWFLTALSVTEQILIFFFFALYHQNFLIILLFHLVSIWFPMPNLSTIFAVKFLRPTCQESSLHPQIRKWHISVYCTSTGCHYSHLHKTPFFVHEKVIISGWQNKRCSFEVFTALIVKIAVLWSVIPCTSVGWYRQIWEPRYIFFSGLLLFHVWR
jgi:hypothetical protein